MAGYLGPKAIQYNVDNSNVTNDSNVGGDLTVGGALNATNGILLGSSTDALDDYEEGTWTLILSGLALNYTDITRQANYVKVGQLVTVRFYARFTSSQIGTGDVQVNLPFTPAANKSAAGCISRHIKGTTGGAAFDQIGLRILGDDPYIYVVKRNNGDGTGYASRTDIFAGGTSNILEGTISYFTDA